VISLGAAGSTINLYSTNSAFVSALVAKINAAGITNVTARQNSDGSTYALIATKGTDVRLAYSNAAGVSVGSAWSNYGLASQIVGSGNATSEVSTYNGQSGAIAKAAAINSVQTKSGVTAVAAQNDVSQAAAVAAGSLAAQDLIINGVAVAATTGITAGDGTGALRAAINAITSQTGVTASVNGSGYLVLSAADGRNITTYATTNANTITGLSVGSYTYRSTLKFTSNSAVTFGGTTTDAGGLNTNSAYNPDLTNSLSLIDISTQAGATTAITSLDAALAQVSSSRAGVGAVQNRLDFTTQSLQTAAENQTAAESRIRDADFAFETAQFTRNQILVQAGTAILAQANSSAQIALQLLQK
jgi:flagellin